MNTDHIAERGGEGRTYAVRFEFTSDRALTEKEYELLIASMRLQLEEPGGWDELENGDFTIIDIKEEVGK